MIIKGWEHDTITAPEDSVALVGCGSEKYDRRLEAKNLYKSGYFTAKWVAAEKVGRPFVLSAEHGLLHPLEFIDPYDTRITDLDAARLNSWSVGVVQDLPECDEVWLFAGKDYIEPILEKLNKKTERVVLPFDGTRGIGDQQKVCKNINYRYGGLNRLL